MTDLTSPIIKKNKLINVVDSNGVKTEFHCFMLEYSKNGKTVQNSIFLDNEGNIIDVGKYIDFNTEDKQEIQLTGDDSNPKNISIREKVLDTLLNFSMERLKPNGDIKGLNDTLLKHYITKTEGIDNSLGEMINLTENQNEDIDQMDKDIDQIYSEEYHYGSFFTVNGNNYGLDTLGDKHVNKMYGSDMFILYKSGPKKVQKKFYSLNPFGLNYQNDSNACGIWSANILNQISKFKNAKPKKDIVKTYNKVQILNPEILLKATAQVSKDLTPQGQEPELKILEDGQKLEDGYVKLKIGETTFAINTKYEENSCIDIQAVALSIPKEELDKNKEINKDFIVKQGEIKEKLKELNLSQDKEDRIEVRKRAIEASEKLYPGLEADIENIKLQSLKQNQPMQPLPQQPLPQQPQSLKQNQPMQPLPQQPLPQQPQSLKQVRRNSCCPNLNEKLAVFNQNRVLSQAQLQKYAKSTPTCPVRQH